MEHIKEYLKKFSKSSSKTSLSSTNKTWILASQVAKLTKTQTARWLRDVKNNENAVLRAMNDLKEIQNIKNKAAYFTYMLKQYKS